MIKLYLFDIEGTTTDINFVHKVLFPYSARQMDAFLRTHKDLPAVKAAVDKLGGVDQAIAQLLGWIKEDKKEPLLKEIQGLIWDQGYKEKNFKAHVYPDVEPFFKQIISNGGKIGIYSSGSVHAQKLIFGHSEAGDLRTYISYYFDTKVGHKREKASYERIAQETGMLPTDIWFFSDMPQELEAAVAAGLKVSHVIREETTRSSFEGISGFELLKP